MTHQSFSIILNQLSYEASNSLNASLESVEAIAAAKQDQPEWTRCAEMGRTSADRMLRCLDDLQFVFSGKELPVEETGIFDLTESLNQITAMLALTSAEQSRRIVFEGGAPLPVRQQKREVERALTGILDAACKASEGWIRVSAEAHGQEARLEVLCTDAQVPARLLTWLNASADDAVLRETDDLSFTAAMLAAGKRLRLLHGTASLDADKAVLAITFHGCEDVPEVEPSTLSILAVEDCDDSFALSELLLREERIVRAHDGFEALRLIRSSRFDMVLMDVHMPGMDGYTTIRAIREWETETGNTRTPIVILSSDDPETQRREAARSGCSGFLRKPLRKPEVGRLIGHLKATRIPN